uniref:Fungal lipase-like domain-containing protein n=1 Tax=Meloidogyne incognita TaxID=6306 RepID=A0A914N8Z5_MELIC
MFGIQITGHSLGGALASLAAAKIVHSKAIPQERIKLVTFGQPRTGDSGFASGMASSLSFYNYRVTRARDLVVHVPPRVFQDYAHYRTEIFYDNDMKPGAKWIRCVGGDEDKNSKTRFLYVRVAAFSNFFPKHNGKFETSIYHVSDHTNYFDRVVSEYGRKGCYSG